MYTTPKVERWFPCLSHLIHAKKKFFFLASGELGYIRGYMIRKNLSITTVKLPNITFTTHRFRATTNRYCRSSYLHNHTQILTGFDEAS